MLYQTYPFRFYPTKDQQAMIYQTYGHCYFVYNHSIEL